MLDPGDSDRVEGRAQTRRSESKNSRGTPSVAQAREGGAQPVGFMMRGLCVASSLALLVVGVCAVYKLWTSDEQRIATLVVALPIVVAIAVLIVSGRRIRVPEKLESRLEALGKLRSYVLASNRRCLVATAVSLLCAYGLIVSILVGVVDVTMNCNGAVAVKFRTGHWLWAQTPRLACSDGPPSRLWLPSWRLWSFFGTGAVPLEDTEASCIFSRPQTELLRASIDAGHATVTCPSPRAHERSEIIQPSQSPCEEFCDAARKAKELESSGGGISIGCYARDGDRCLIDLLVDETLNNNGMNAKAAVQDLCRKRFPSLHCEVEDPSYR